MSAGAAPMVPPPVAAARWFPDPLGRYELRYWDGTEWTDHAATAGVQSVDPVG